MLFSSYYWAGAFLHRVVNDYSLFKWSRRCLFSLRPGFAKNSSALIGRNGYDRSTS